MAIRLPNGTSDFINAREVAPGSASYDMFNGKPERASLDGGLAVAVPLEAQGLQMAWEK